MSWKSGARLFDEIIEIIKHEVPNEDSRKNIYRKLINVFENEDCDTLSSCLEKDPAYDMVYNEMYLLE